MIAPNIVIADKNPKSLLGKKLELTITKKPQPSIKDVENIALPVENIVSELASIKLPLFIDNSCLNLTI